MWVLAVSIVVGNGMVVFKELYTRYYKQKESNIPENLSAHWSFANMCTGIYMLGLLLSDLHFEV